MPLDAHPRNKTGLPFSGQASLFQVGTFRCLRSPLNSRTGRIAATVGGHLRRGIRVRTGILGHRSATQRSASNRRRRHNAAGTDSSNFTLEGGLLRRSALHSGCQGGVRLDGAHFRNNADDGQRGIRNSVQRNINQRVGRPGSGLDRGGQKGNQRGRMGAKTSTQSGDRHGLLVFLRSGIDELGDNSGSLDRLRGSDLLAHCFNLGHRRGAHRHHCNRREGCQRYRDLLNRVHRQNSVLQPTHHQMQEIGNAVNALFRNNQGGGGESVVGRVPSPGGFLEDAGWGHAAYDGELSHRQPSPSPAPRKPPGRGRPSTGDPPRTSGTSTAYGPSPSGEGSSRADHNNR